MAKKSNYVFPIEHNTALEIAKIIKNFYLLEGATGEELLEKRKGLSTQLLLGGLQEEVFTQELLNNIYANLNNEEALISLIKEKFQSVDYESALFLLRWTKDSQSPYYPRMQGDKPVEQFNEDYDFSRNLLIAYINDHGLTAIKNLPGRVIRVQKELIKEMANNFRAKAIDDARNSLTANQEALVELRGSIKEQKQKIADLKAANPDAQTGELEAKLDEDRNLAIEKYKIVKGQRRSLRDTLEERAILERDFADVVGGKTVNKLQLDAEREEDDEKLELEKKVLDLIKRSTSSLQDPAKALEIITLNVRGKFNEKEVKELLGEDTSDIPYSQQPQQVIENNEQAPNSNEETNEQFTENTNLDNANVESDNEVNTVTNQNGTIVENTENVSNDVNTNLANDNSNTTPVYDANNTMVDTNATNINANGDTTDTTDTNGDNGQEMFNSIYNQTLEETQEQVENNEGFQPANEQVQPTQVAEQVIPNPPINEQVAPNAEGVATATNQPSDIDSNNN